MRQADDEYGGVALGPQQAVEDQAPDQASRPPASDPKTTRDCPAEQRWWQELTG